MCSLLPLLQVFLLRVGNGHGGLGVTEAIDSLLQGRPHIKPLSHETFLKPVTEGALLYGMHLVRRRGWTAALGK